MGPNAGTPPPSEASPLLITTTSDDGGASSIHSTVSSEVSASTALLVEEMDQPWPATYTRSISLLASPIIHADRVNLVAKSPRPGGTPMIRTVARLRVSHQRSASMDRFLI